jgi:FdhE protein
MSFEPPGVPGEVVYLRLPRPAELFARRARRFRELAPGNPMGEFLDALADVAEAQAAALARLPADGEGGASAVLPTAAPLRATSHSRAPAWRDALSAIVEALQRRPWPAPATQALRRLAGAWPEELEALADGVLVGMPASPDLAAAPFVGAALQVYFTALASRLSTERVERSQGGCPVCDSAPVAGVVLGDDRLRYLSCSLCGSEWNLVRIQCWNCRNTGGIHYLGVAGDDGAVKAEACTTCGAYLKIFYREKMPLAEPMADDVASLTLDLLAAQEGLGRSGANLFLLGGAEV